MRFVMFAILAACHSTVQPPPANRQISKYIDGDLDYRSPVRRLPKSSMLTQFTSKCMTGDRAACLRASMFTFGVDLQPQIETNCAAGDELSCRAIAAIEQGFRTEYPYKLPSAELRRGCVAGLWAECDLLMESGVDDEIQFASEIHCRYTRFACSRAGDHYLHTDPSRARYLLELGCQAADAGACLSLAHAYVDGELREPVAGRGMELVRYLCRRYPDDCTNGRRPWDLPTTN